MRSLIVLILFLVLILLSAAPAQAVFTGSLDPPGLFDANADGLQGLHLNRASTDGFPHGISWDVDYRFAWASGLDVTLDYSYPGVSPTPPDLVLAYSSLLHADNLRLRADDARMALGPHIGHPVLPFQLQVAAGTPSAPLGGLSVGTYGYTFGLYLYNRNPWEKRNTISLQNLYCLETDSQENGTGDLQLYNFQSQAPVYTVQPDNSFRLVAPRESFFAAPPTDRPTVSGSWSDGSAAKSLLAAMVRLGLVVDNTTP